MTGQGQLACPQADRNLDGADCVLWYTLGLTHVVRCEVRAGGGRLLCAARQLGSATSCVLQSCACGRRGLPVPDTVDMQAPAISTPSVPPAGLAGHAGGGAQLPPQALGLLHPGGHSAARMDGGTRRDNGMHLLRASVQLRSHHLPALSLLLPFPRIPRWTCRPSLTSAPSTLTWRAAPRPEAAASPPPAAPQPPAPAAAGRLAPAPASPAPAPAPQAGLALPQRVGRPAAPSPPMPSLPCSPPASCEAAAAVPCHIIPTQPQWRPEV